MAWSTDETAAPPIEIGSMTYRPVARRTRVRLGGRGAGLFAIYDRPGRIEVTRKGSVQQSVAIPNRELQLRVAVFALALLGALIRRKRGSS